MRRILGFFGILPAIGYLVYRNRDQIRDFLSRSSELDPVRDVMNQLPVRKRGSSSRTRSRKPPTRKPSTRKRA